VSCVLQQPSKAGRLPPEGKGKASWRQGEVRRGEASKNY
jgi:hypothetical protein